MCFDTSWRFSPRRRQNSVAWLSRRDVAHKRGVHLHRSIWGLPRVQNKLNSKNNWDAIICPARLELRWHTDLLAFQNTENKKRRSVKKYSIIDQRSIKFRMNLWGYCFFQNANQKLQRFLPWNIVCTYVFHCWSWDKKCSQPVKAVSSISDKIPGIPYTQWFTFVFWYFGGQWVKKLSGGAFLLFLLICRCFFPKIFYPIMYFVCMYKTKKICLHFALWLQKGTDLIYSLKLPRQTTEGANIF